MAMAGGGGLNRSSSRGQLPPQELLDDLCCRFLLNAPKEELKSFERILFLLEYAHWFYEDNSVEHNPNLKSLSFKDFTFLMFKSCTALRPYIAHLDDIYNDFNNYKFRIPVSGAIILDDTYERCLLVKGWEAGASWSFPCGKRNKDEEDHACAVRGVLEETGCDVSTLLNLDDYIEVSIGQPRVRLYIITGVKRDTVFAPQTKKEISEISWHRIDDLLPASDDAVSRGVNGIELYMVAPFLASVSSDLHFISFIYLFILGRCCYGHGFVIVALNKRRKTTACLFYSASKPPTFPKPKSVAYTLCCLTLFCVQETKGLDYLASSPAVSEI
ncbi:unnamed protein product [Urochloa humidicola]